MTKTYTLNFTGDVMLARLIDQLFPQHNYNPRESNIITTFQTHYPHLSPGHYTHASPWGSALPLFQPPSSSLNLINLETAVTTAAEPWPDKRFNYRMHPANLEVLREGCVDFASLANNHTLDFGTEGLVETVWAVKGLGLGFAGAGESVDECRRAAVLDLPRKVSRVSAAAAAAAVGDGGGGNGVKKWSEKEKHGGHGHERFDSESNGTPTKQHKIHVYAASDHPRDWSGVPTFHLIDYSPATRRHLKTLLSSASSSPEEQKPALKIFSIHWGPNYTWQPSPDIRSLAHFLIDECAVDIVHGHSAHHVQGVERYKGKLIMYGCGDFVDDYALNERFRNDLGAVWRVVVAEEDRGDGDGAGLGLRLERLEVYPTRCDRFQVTLLDREDEDHGWVRRKITALSEEMDTVVRRELGEDGQVVVDLN